MRQELHRVPELAATAKTPRVILRLKQERVTVRGRARARVAVRPRSWQSADVQESQAKSLRPARIKVVAERGGKRFTVRARLTNSVAEVALPRLRKGTYRVRAVFLGNELWGRSKSPYKSLTSVAGFPNAASTGVPAGVALKTYTGSSTISKANTVINGKTLGCIRVMAPGVVIRNSRISCRGSVVVASYDGDYSGAPLVLENVEISCQNSPGTAVGDSRVVVRWADIHGCENGFDINQKITVEHSFIHDLYNGAAAHTDGIQLAMAHLEASNWVAGARNVAIRHNRIYSVGVDGSLGTSAIISNPAEDENILIKRNLLAGGAYTLYCDSGSATNYRVIANHFSRKFSRKVERTAPLTVVETIRSPRTFITSREQRCTSIECQIAVPAGADHLEARQTVSGFAHTQMRARSFHAREDESGPA